MDCEKAYGQRETKAGVLRGVRNKTMAGHATGLVDVKCVTSRM